MDFNSWQRKNYATATWSRDNKVLRAIGKFAVERGYCDFNPFTSLPSKSMVNADRNQHIERDQVLSAMDYCLVSDTRLSLAMARFAGMRTPSELRTLKWEHVDLDRGQLVVLDSKKKRYRVMPIFDIVRDELNRQRSHSGDSQYVASKLFRDNSDSDNYNRIKKAIRRSGQLCWMRLRQNLRSSCENDLLEIFPERLVAEWVGHSVGVSRDHYQKQRDKTYKDAILVAREIGI
ncbi:MAG: site-specific integrase [Planctomycetota bacterium]